MSRKTNLNRLLRKHDPAEVDELLMDEDDEPKRTREPRVDRSRHKINPRRPGGRRPKESE